VVSPGNGTNCRREESKDDTKRRRSDSVRPRRPIRRSTRANTTHWRPFPYSSGPSIVEQATKQGWQPAERRLNETQNSVQAE
jgi:hypothetical protein